MSVPSHPMRNGSAELSEIPDRLGHEPLARNLAQALISQSSTGLVIGLCGEWGSGKSWVLGRVRRLLKEAEKTVPKTPYWLEFNPWQWSGSDALVNEFFGALGRAVEEAEGKTKSRRWFLGKSWTAAQFRAYGARINTHSVIIGGYSQLLAGASGTLAIFVAAKAINEPDWFSVALSALSASVAVASGFLKLLGDFFNQMDAAKKAEAEWHQRSPQDLKKALALKIKALPRPIVVVFDDLDRLTADEVASVFQLVKAQADFPNMVYLLAFDRAIIESSLERIAPGVPANGLPPGRGRHFLEKIVPVLFDLPNANNAVIERILRAEIEDIPGTSLSESNHRWSDWWNNGLSAFFKNLRDVERFINSASFYTGFFTQGEGELEVDALDFMAIETLRLFEPQVYSAIASQKELFIAQRPLADLILQQRYSHVAAPRDVEASRREFLNAICDVAHEKEATRQLIRRLFPATDELLRREGESAISTVFYGLGSAPNVSESAFFNRFFRFSIGPDEWSRREGREFLDTAGERTKMVEQWRGIAQGTIRPRSVPAPTPEPPQILDDTSRDRLLEFCDLLERQLRNFPLAHTSAEVQKLQDIATGLFDCADVLPAKWGGKWIAGSMEERVSDLVFTALLHIPDFSTRRTATLATLAETHSWAFASWFVLRESQRHENPGSGSHLLHEKTCLSPQDISPAKTNCLERIEVAAASGELWKRPRAKNWIYLWQDWGDDAAQIRLRRALGQVLATPLGIGDFLQIFLGTTHSSTLGDGPAQVWRSWVLDPTELSRFVPLGRLEAALWGLQKSLSEELRAVAPSLSEPRIIHLPPSLRLRWICLRVANFAFEQHEQGLTNMMGWSRNESELDAELERFLASCCV